MKRYTEGLQGPEKIHQILLFPGAKFEPLDQVEEFHGILLLSKW